MILPAVLFTGVQLVVTFLHWEKFTFGSMPFYVWFASYLLPPPIFLAAYLWQQRRAGNADRAAGRPVCPRGLRQSADRRRRPASSRRRCRSSSFPPLLMPHFAWKLTPLTTRTLCGWLMLVGAMLLSLARENSRTRSRLASPMLVLMLPMLLLQMSRFASQVDWSNKILVARPRRLRRGRRRSASTSPAGAGAPRSNRSSFRQEAFMPSKNELHESIELELNILEHLYDKLPRENWQQALDYRPSPGAALGARPPALPVVRGHRRLSRRGRRGFEGFRRVAKRSEDMPAEDFPAALARQREDRRSFRRRLGRRPGDRRSKSPIGQEMSLGKALLELPFRWLVAYRMQLYLYAKALGADLWTPNCWYGIQRDRPAPKAWS